MTSEPAGIDCGSQCSDEYDSGATVVLNATPEPGSSFAGWDGDADCLDGSVTMASDRSCEARFELQQGEPPLFADGFESGDTSAWIAVP